MPDRRSIDAVVVLVRAALGFCCAVLSVGLAAHLVAASVTHEGAGRDLLVLALAAILGTALLHGLQPKRAIILPLIVAAACVAFGWLLLEDSTRVVASQLASTCVALAIVLFAFVQALLLCIRAAAVMRPALRAVLLRRDHSPRLASYVDIFVLAPASAVISRATSAPRRGPPRVFRSSLFAL